jgi:hypothetical protein
MMNELDEIRYLENHLHRSPDEADKARRIPEHFYDLAELLHGLEKRFEAVHIHHTLELLLISLDAECALANIIQRCKPERLQLLGREALLEVIQDRLEGVADGTHLGWVIEHTISMMGEDEVSA